MEAAGSSEMWLPPTKLHGVISHKTAVFMLIAVMTLKSSTDNIPNECCSWVRNSFDSCSPEIGCKCWPEDSVSWRRSSVVFSVLQAFAAILLQIRARQLQSTPFRIHYSLVIWRYAVWATKNIVKINRKPQIKRIYLVRNTTMRPKSALLSGSTKWTLKR
jgi:hypothetical protein